MKKFRHKKEAEKKQVLQVLAFGLVVLAPANDYPKVPSAPGLGFRRFANYPNP